MGGAINQLGSVDNGTAVTDFEEQERERKISISPALCHVEHRGSKINIVDCPGYSEFYVDALYGLWATDNALLVLDAAAGVEVHTIKMYDAARELNVRIIGVVNKLDNERADFAAAVADMNESRRLRAMRCRCLSDRGPLPGCRGCSRARHFASGEIRRFSRDGRGVAIAREALIDAVAATDDDLTMKYLEEGELSPEELVAGLRGAIATGTLVPVLCVSAVREVGVQALLDFLVDAALSPVAAPPRRALKGEEEVELTADSDGPIAIIVFKTMTDPYVGRISLLRVLSGTAKADMDVYNTAGGKRERLSGLAVVQGWRPRTRPGIDRGDMGQRCASGLPPLAIRWRQGSNLRVSAECAQLNVCSGGDRRLPRDTGKLSDAGAPGGRTWAEIRAQSRDGELLVSGLGPCIRRSRGRCVACGRDDGRTARGYRGCYGRGARAGAAQKQTGGADSSATSGSSWSPGSAGRALSS